MITPPTPGNYRGLAFDVGLINGTVANAANPNVQGFKDACRTLGATKVLGPGDPGHDTHVHCGW